MKFGFKIDLLYSQECGNCVTIILSTCVNALKVYGAWTCVRSDRLISAETVVVDTEE
jgi:hypothetical protein